jgi:hypothetical protein
MTLDDPLRAAILSLAEARGDAASFCPSEAARAVDPRRWRALMPAVRAAAAALAAEGRIRVLQKGRPADPLTARGPIRLRRS